MPGKNLSILITGASGQLGQCLRDLVPADFTLVAFEKSVLDISDKVQIDRVFANHTFDFCINCAAFTAVDLAESESERAFLINAESVRNLASTCREYNTTLIHISSDYVYDNGITHPLVETDPTEPKSVYGKSKLKGDNYALRENPKTIVLRTSWLYSEYGKNFVLTMLRLGRERSELRVVADQHGIPTYARDLANAIFQIVSSEPESFAYGIYHFANQGATTWYDFAKVVIRKDGQLTPIFPIETKEFPTPATRPAYSVLDSTKFSVQFSCKIRHWHDALDECLTRIGSKSKTDN